MREIHNDMDKIFRDKLGEYQEQPPEEIWSGIKSGMGKKSRGIILIPLWQAAAGMALIITAGSIFFYLNRPLQNQLTVVSDSSPKSTEVHSTSENKSVLPDSKNDLMAESKSSDTQEEVDVMSGQNKASSVITSAEIFEKFTISENIYGADLADKGFDEEHNFHFPSELMSDPYLQPGRQDAIPRNKKPVNASWDMLTTIFESDMEGEDHQDQLSLTAQVTPTYSYRDIGNISSAASEQFNQYESGKISYSGGLQFGFKTSDRLSFHTGLMYAQLGYNVDQVGAYNVSKADLETEILFGHNEVSTVYETRNSIGTIGSESRSAEFIGNNNSLSNDKEYLSYDNLPVNVDRTWDAQSVGKIEQYFQYLEVPFLMRYKILDQKLDVNLLGGLSTNILVGNKTTLTTDGQSSNLGSSGNVKSINYMGNMGLGFDYSLGKNLLLTMEPQFKYFLNSINKSNLISNRPYMLGMFTGVRFVW